MSVDNWGIEVNLSGDREIQRALKQMNPQIHKNVLRSALRSAMKPGFDASQRMIPEESRALSDAMKISIKAFPPFRMSGRIWPDKNFTRTFKGKTRRPIKYAWLVEGGHDVVRGGKVIATVAPQPFIRDAFEQTKDEQIRRFRKQFLRGAQRQWRKMTDGPKVKRRLT